MKSNKYPTPSILSPELPKIISIKAMSADSKVTSSPTYRVKFEHHTPRRLSKLLSTVALTSAAFGLSACNTIPPIESQTMVAQPNIPIDQTYVTHDAETISTSQSPSIAVQRWQRFYGDDKLKALIQLALENNNDLENALLAIKKSKAHYQITENSTLPTLNTSGNMTRSANHMRDKSSSASYGVNLAMTSYEVDLWGRIASQKEQALQSYLATTSGKDAVQIALISSVAQRYIELSYAQAQYDLAKQTVESRKKSLFIAEKRFEAGVDSKSPSLQSAAALESAKLSMYNAETSIIKLNNALELLIGVPLSTGLKPKSGVTKITNQKIFSAGLPSELLHYRPDILQSEYKLKAAGANIEAARAAYFPSIRLNGNLGLSSSTNLSNLFQNSAMGWSFGPSVSLPIFDAGKLKANHEVAKITREQALVNYEKSIQTAFKEVLDVFADRVTLKQRLKSQYKLQKNYNETFKIADARYKSGLSNYLAVLDAQRSLYNTQQGILQLEQAKLISQVQLYQVLGGGVAMDVPIELSVPNHPKLVQFIKGNVDNNDAKSKNTTVTTTNVARGSTTSRLATVEDFKPDEDKKILPKHTVNSVESAKETAKDFFKMTQKNLNK